MVYISPREQAFLVENQIDWLSLCYMYLPAVSSYLTFRRYRIINHPGTNIVAYPSRLTASLTAQRSMYDSPAASIVVDSLPRIQGTMRLRTIKQTHQPPAFRRALKMKRNAILILPIFPNISMKNEDQRYWFHCHKFHVWFSKILVIHSGVSH